MGEPGIPHPTRPPPGDASPRRLLGFLIAGAAIAGLTALISVECAPGVPHARAYPSRQLPPEPPQHVQAAKGPSSFYFPCSDCHEDEPTNRTVRKLEDDHEDLELAHGDLWCLHCHDADDRDQLHLADGRLLPFADSWQLCVQCHGQQKEPWRAGVHGKRTGHWWGAKEVWTCVSCHSPHAPHFQAIEPKPPPKPPSQITLRAPTAPQEETHE